MGVHTATIAILRPDEKEVAPAAESVRVAFRLAEAEGVPEEPVGQTANHDVDGVLHHDVYFVLAAHHAALQQAEPWGQNTVVLIEPRVRT